MILGGLEDEIPHQHKEKSFHSENVKKKSKRSLYKVLHDFEVKNSISSVKRK